MDKPQFTKLKDGYVVFIKEDNKKYNPIGILNRDNNGLGITGYIYINRNKSGAIIDRKELLNKWKGLKGKDLIIKKIRVKIL